MKRVVDEQGVRSRMVVEESDGHAFVILESSFKANIYRCNLCGIEGFTFRGSEMLYFRYDDTHDPQFARRSGAFTCNEFKLRSIIT